MLTKDRVASMIEESDGRFLVDRAVYCDPEIYESEIDQFFENGWVFLAHEGQIAKPGDYFSTRMGRQPVFLVRKKDGGIGGYINACAHKAASLVPFESGRASAFTCRFHGWVFNAEGKCIKIKNEESGAYAGLEPGQSMRDRFSLTPIARIESYRGFIWGSLNPDVPVLKDWLGGATTWIDLLVDQSTEGLEVLKGSSTYVIQGNWKMQAENGVDGYHVSTVHRVFASTVSNREERDGVKGLGKTEAGSIVGEVKTATYDFGNGHLGIWAERSTPEVHPLWMQKERLEREYSPERVNWMLYRGKNLFIFPNVLIMDNPSSQIRVIQPVGPGSAEITVRCVAPIGESAEARQARMRKFEDFYLTTGMATSDDLAALESTHVGGYGRAARWNDLARGVTEHKQGSEDKDLESIGGHPATFNSNWDHETLYYGFFRYWRDTLMRGAK